MPTKTSTCTVQAQQVRDVLDTIADKWTLVVLDALDGHTLRFADLQRAIGGISQKVLTQTLREMERNGFIKRTVYAQVPPRVEYALTATGDSVAEAICGVWKWTAENHARVEEVRAAFDTARANVLSASASAESSR